MQESSPAFLERLDIRNNAKKKKKNEKLGKCTKCTSAMAKATQNEQR